MEGREKIALIARLVESREIAPEVRHFVFDVPSVERLTFAAGQFVSFTELFDGLKVTRAYSIASPPDGNSFELCLNRVLDGRFSPYLFQLHPGEEIEMKGPLGGFTVRDPNVDAIFVATGTGIAPIRGILKDQLRRGSTRDYLLLFGVRHEHGILYSREFEALARQHPNFRFWPTLSRPDASWKSRTGHVQTHLEEALSGRSGIHVYICGMKAMVDDVRARLKEKGFDRKQIIYEKYD
jgi:NAD(P)H-flavin reductase